MTGLKPFTARDTGINAMTNNPRLSNLMLKIMAVNALTLLILLFGIIYLGQYQTRLISAKLETFNAEVDLIAMGINASDPRDTIMRIRDYHRNTGHGMQFYDHMDSEKVLINLPPLERTNQTKRRYHSLEILKSLGRMLTSLLPDRDLLPAYDHESKEQILQHVSNGENSLSAWRDAEGRIILAAGALLTSDNIIRGALIITRIGSDIETELGQVWLNIIKIFVGALVLTLLLSIYLANTIARPLNRLARAAERVRGGKSRSVQIPDLSHRYDEIGDLSLSMRAMTEALWQRMDSIDAFAADVAHELKNPLTSLRSAIETLPKLKKKADKDKLTAIIQHDLTRIDRLITDISRASRLDAELGRGDVERIDLEVFLRGVLAHFMTPDQRAAQTDECVYEVDILDKMLCIKGRNLANLKVMGAPTQLMQVFDNLITNALSFSSPQGTVTIAVRRIKDKRVRIAIEDEGIGIPEEKLENVFERFYTDRPQGEGYGNHSGLGLSIAKQIIEAMNGSLNADNIINKKGAVTGARFVIVLPLV